uniref:Mitochondrial ribosomal protein S35 n=1 Tax=Oryzias sinensis TaxID=183150 RepID=A0A8C7ZN66_9TELE
MAAQAGKALLCLGRTSFSYIGQSKPASRVTYATALSVNSSSRNKGLPERNARGTLGRRPRREAGEPRTEKMAMDQDWTAVYPAATPFRPNSVPLPVRMGYPVKGGVPPQKKGNLELIKIPNFLHLTPAAIKKHCEALKPFCTEWPSALDTEPKCDQQFPVKVESRDFVSAGPSIRNPAARIVQLSIKLSSLNLDDHARKKMLKLVGERYCRDTDVLTIRADSCPLRQQNYDYAMYLLTVLYHGTNKHLCFPRLSWYLDQTEWLVGSNLLSIFKNDRFGVLELLASRRECRRRALSSGEGTWVELLLNRSPVHNSGEFLFNSCCSAETMS